MRYFKISFNKKVIINSIGTNTVFVNNKKQIKQVRKKAKKQNANISVEKIVIKKTSIR